MARLDHQRPCRPSSARSGRLARWAAPISLTPPPALSLHIQLLLRRGGAHTDWAASEHRRTSRWRRGSHGRAGRSRETPCAARGRLQQRASPSRIRFRFGKEGAAAGALAVRGDGRAVAALVAGGHSLSLSHTPSISLYISPSL